MLALVQSATVIGIDAFTVVVEVDVARRGLPHFSVVGLPDASVKESRDRVRAALKNIGFMFPLRPVTVNLAPADLKKEGTAFDLPIAIGLAATEGALPMPSLKGTIFVGELSLDGGLRPVRGAISMGLLAKQSGFRLILPEQNAGEAAVVEGAAVYGARNLPQVFEFLRGETDIPQSKPHLPEGELFGAMYEEDFQDVKGQEHAKRALEVAASGGHNVIMIGPPGAGKTMLARRVPTILPPISFEEAVQTTRIHSVAGVLRHDMPILTQRPVRSPHHTISDIALVGGGKVPRPGEVSLSHNGVLFLDELPEFSRNALEVLRQPIEEGAVTVSRAAGSITFPARFMLLAAMNPCPCGYYGNPQRACSCNAGMIHRYRARISGPLLDRIDIHLDVPAVPYKDLASERSGERSKDIRERVARARAMQTERLSGDGIFSNSQMGARLIKKHCILEPAAKALLDAAMQRLRLSARAHSRILKLSRTVADLDGAKLIAPQHISEAIQYRTLDREI